MNTSLINILERLANNEQNDASMIIAKKLHQGFIDNHFYNIKELSDLCHVHESTITVFSKKLGYTGYRELLFVLKLEHLKYEHPHREISDQSAIQEFNLTLINHFQSQANQEIILDLVKVVKEADKVFLYASYQLDDLATFFAENLSLKQKEVLFNKTKLYGYKNTACLTKKDVAIFFVSGQDNDLLEYIFREVIKKTKKIFVFSSTSQMKKFSEITNLQNLDITNLPSDNLYRHYLLNYYISLFFYLW